MVDSAILKFEVINKTYLQVKDIRILMDCSTSKASVYKKKFLMFFQEKKYEPDYFKIDIPTADFIEYYNINVNLIRSNAIALLEMRKENASRL